LAAIWLTRQTSLACASKASILFTADCSTSQHGLYRSCNDYAAKQTQSKQSGSRTMA